jgi:hypothetical protein
MDKTKIIIILLFLILLLYIYNRTREDFTTYMRCQEKPIAGIMQTILNKFNVTKKEINFDLYIPCGYNGVEKELKLLTLEDSRGKKIFGIDGCDGIVSKNRLWSSLRFCFGTTKASKIMPLTVVLSDKNDMKNFKKSYDPENIYILKKNLQRKQGILITHSLNEIMRAEKQKYMVVQRYIDSYVINKRKMNLRIYFLMVITPDGKKRGYIHKLGKCLYTSKDINKNSNAELIFEEHITNSYTLEKSIYKNNPQGLDDLEKYLGKYYKNPHALFKNMDKLFSQFFKCVKDNLGNLQNLDDTTRFQLFGADVIFDNTLTPYLLEVNKGPDMKFKDEIDQKMKTKVYLDVFEKASVIEISDQNYVNGFNEIQPYARDFF